MILVLIQRSGKHHLLAIFFKSGSMFVRSSQIPDVVPFPAVFSRCAGEGDFYGQPVEIDQGRFHGYGKQRLYRGWQAV